MNQTGKIPNPFVRYAHAGQSCESVPVKQEFTIATFFSLSYKAKKCIYCITLSMFFFAHAVYNEKYSQNCKSLCFKQQCSFR